MWRHGGNKTSNLQNFTKNHYQCVLWILRSFPSNISFSLCLQVSGSQKTLCFGDDFGKTETMVGKFNPPLHTYLSLPVYATPAHSFSQQLPRPQPPQLPEGGARGLSAASLPLLRGEGRPWTEVLRRYSFERVCESVCVSAVISLFSLPFSGATEIFFLFILVASHWRLK